MNTGIVKSKASGLALMGKVLVGVMVVGVVPQESIAKTTDAQFQQYLTNVCNLPTAPSMEAALMCLTIAGGGPVGSIPTSSISSNLGSTNASGTTQNKKRGGHKIPEEGKSKSEKGASADGGGWGFLIAPQTSNSVRADTELENGYQSKLTGLVIGGDYQFSDSFLIGLVMGRNSDKATFLNSAGYLNTRNDNITLYGTWTPSEKTSIDGYFGYGKLALDNQRHIAVGAISGTTSGSTTGRQIMGGLSTSYNIEFGKTTLSPFLNIDYIKTNIKGYSEKGSTLLEMRYGDRSVTSLTSSLGGRAGASYQYDWGMLLPSIRLAAVHEFQNRTRQIYNELVSTLGYGFSVQTDSPDRNYLNLGLGVSASLNRGGQLFLDYEKRTQDKLLSSWAVSLGGLFEF